MQITRTRPDSQLGPADRFHGTVWIDEIAVAPEPARMRAFSVHFAPTARTAWHTHPNGQILHVLEGTGRVQRKDGPVETITAGDTVHFDPGEWHWHGAAANAFMTHLAMQEADETRTDAHWGDQVTEQEYSATAR